MTEKEGQSQLHKSDLFSSQGDSIPITSALGIEFLAFRIYQLKKNVLCSFYILVATL